MSAHSKHMNRAHLPPCMHSAWSKYTEQAIIQLLTTVHVCEEYVLVWCIDT